MMKGAEAFRPHRLAIFQPIREAVRACGMGVHLRRPARTVLIAQSSRAGKNLLP
jgi:hypothetical protein